MTDNPNDPRPFGSSLGGSTPPMSPPVAAEGGWGMPPANSPAYPPQPALGQPGTSPGVPGASDTSSSKGGIGMLFVGLVLIVVSLVAGGVMLMLAAGQQRSAVEDMARAPVDCLTELDFTETGTFYVYAETEGEVGELDGTCSNADRDYSFDDAPRVTLVLTDEDEEVIDLERTSGIEYDTGSFAGTAVRTFEIDDEGAYVLRVESREDDAVVAVGRDMSEVGTGLGAAGLVVAVLGTLLGVVLIVLALVRRRRRGAAVPTVPSPASPMPPTTPPSPATWGTPPHTMPPGTPGATAPVTPPPPPPTDDSFWRPPPPPTS